MVECQCVDAGFPCRAKATQEDMLCDHCRRNRCTPLVVRPAADVSRRTLDGTEDKEGFGLL